MTGRPARTNEEAPVGARPAPGSVRQPTLHATVAALALLTLASSGQAQAPGRPIELGMDGAISYSMVDEVAGVPANNAQTWAFPLQRMRAGFFATDRFQIQLTMAFSVADFGNISTVQFSAGLAGLYRMTGQGDRSGLFVSWGGGWSLLADNGTDGQWSAAGGLGIRLPAGDRLAFRPALEIGRSFASDRRPAATAISTIFGVSFFTQ